MSRETSTDKNELGLRIFPEAQPSGSGYTPCPLSELASDISRTNRIDCAVANSPEIDFALVLSRTIDSIKNDPSQLRNTVYELARTKLGVPLAGCLRDRLAHRFAQAAWCRLHPTTSLQEGIQPQSRSRTRVPQRGAIRAETGAACSTSALAPILFGFPLHRGCIRVLALDPVRRAP